MMRSVHTFLAALACAMGALLMVTSSASAAPPPADEVFVDWDHTWTYLHPTKAINDPDLADNQFFTLQWFTNGYDTTQPVIVPDDVDPSGFVSLMWQDSQAPFQYGGVNVLAGALAPNTNLTTPAAGDRFSMYLRTEFTLDSAVDDLLVEIAQDDMTRWFIDGQEVLELTEVADTSSLPRFQDQVDLFTEDATTTYSLPFSLEAGPHTLAVIVHNDQPSSSDLGFAARVISPGGANVWQENASTNWHIDANWRGNNIAMEATDYAVFGNVLTADPRSIWMDQDVTLDGIQFDEPGDAGDTTPARYAIGGRGTMTLQGNGGVASLNSLAGSHELQVRVRLANETESNIATFDDGTNPSAPASLLLRNQFDLDGNTLNKSGGGELLVFSNADPGTTGTVNINEGSLAGDGTVFGTVNVASGATVHPTGMSSGSEGRASHLTIADDATFAAGSNLTLSLYGDGQNDRLIVGGELAMNGEITVQLDAAYVAADGHSFDLVDWGSITGPLPMPTNLPDIGDLEWNFSQFASDGILSIGDAPPTGDPLDFNNDMNFDVVDINLLTGAGNLVNGVNPGDPGFDAALDVNGDNVIDSADLTEWLAGAAEKNGFTEPYLTGDANLDGTVQFLDFQQIANNWQQMVDADGEPVVWGSGDFNGDGTVQFLDFQQIANNWQQSISMAASPAATVPEPAGLALVALGIFGLAVRRRR